LFRGPANVVSQLSDCDAVNSEIIVSLNADDGQSERMRAQGKTAGHLFKIRARNWLMLRVANIKARGARNGLGALTLETQQHFIDVLLTYASIA